jgi:hypothetical protein
VSDSLPEKIIWFVKIWSRASVPIGPVFIAYLIWMPATGSPAFGELQLHQQLIALSFLPALVWTLWRFVGYLNEYDQTPEERVLGGDE